MNERIKELAEQAEEEIKAEYEDESRRNRRLYNEIFLPKFAQLIVAECAQVCRDQPNHYALKADRDNCAVAIEEHFGVDE
jgi:hypothetical protein